MKRLNDSQRVYLCGRERARERERRIDRNRESNQKTASDGCFMPHTWTRHATHMNVLCHMCILMRHFTHMHASRSTPPCAQIFFTIFSKNATSHTHTYTQRDREAVTHTCTSTSSASATTGSISAYFSAAATSLVAHKRTHKRATVEVSLSPPCVYKYIYIYIYIYYVCVCILCIYTYIYIYMYMCVCTYILIMYIYIHDSTG